MRHMKRIIGLLLAFLLVASIFLPTANLAKADVPTVPVLISPANNAVLATASENLSVYLQWNSVPGVVYYKIEMSVLSDFYILVFAATGTTNYWLTPKLGLGVDYYWHVKAVNNEGESAWSSTRHLSIVPKPPILVSPVNNYCLGTGYIKFQWDTISISDVTEIQIARTSVFSNPISITWSYYTYSNGRYHYQFPVYLPDVGGYYWRTRALSLNGIHSGWSSIAYFWLNVPPTIAPALVYPENNRLVTNLSVILDWRPVPNSTSYQIQIKNKRGLIVSASTTRIRYEFNAINNHYYSWRVKAINCTGDGPWSSWSNFYVLLPPAIPQLTFPAPNQIFSTTNHIQLTWTRTPVDTVSYYDVRVKNMNTGVIKLFRITIPELIFIGKYNCQYMWKVRAVNRVGVSHWTTRYFSIIDKTPPVISVSYPPITNQSRVTITGKGTDFGSGVNAVWVNGKQITLNSDGTFILTVELNLGKNSFIIGALDNVGNQAKRRIFSVFYDNEPPSLKIMNPQYSLYEKHIKVVTDVVVVGQVTDNNRVKGLLINNEPVQIAEDGSFIYQTKLHYGPNTIHITVIDYAGNETKKELLISKLQAQKRIVFTIGNSNMVVNGPNEEGKIVGKIQPIDPGRGTVPLIENGRTFIPVRAFIEALGGKVYWNNRERKVTIILPSHSIKIKLWVEKNTALVNGEKVPIDSNPEIKPFIKNGRTYLPLRFIAKNLGCLIDWNSTLWAVTITMPVYPSP